MSILETLITDRTSADVANVRTLTKKGWASMTAAEQAAWLAGLRGAYNASDLNRVGEAVGYVVAYLNGMQATLDAYREQYDVAAAAVYNVTWDTITVTVKTDWTIDDIPTQSQMAAYLANVDAASSAITISRSLPDSMSRLTYVGANEIERVLLAEHDAAQDFEAAVKDAIERTAATFVYCGQPFSGQIWEEFTT